MAHAWLCNGCGHLASRHSAEMVGEKYGETYRCRDCDCKITQESPLTPLNKRQYDEWAQENPTLTWTYERANR